MMLLKHMRYFFLYVLRKHTGFPILTFKNKKLNEFEMFVFHCASFREKSESLLGLINLKHIL